MPSSRCGELLGVVWGEGDTIYILGESLATKDYILLLPVPHCHHVVWVSSNGGQ